jgi:hypothetical protein
VNKALMNVEDLVLLSVDHQSSLFHTTKVPVRRRFAARLPSFVAPLRPRIHHRKDPAGVRSRKVFRAAICPAQCTNMEPAPRGYAFESAQINLDYAHFARGEIRLRAQGMDQ